MAACCFNLSMPLSTPTLTVTDNQNGTATLTVADGDPSASNLIRCAQIELDEPVWLDITTVSGNDSVTVPVQLGLKWFAVFSSLSGESVASPPLSAIITPSPIAVFEQCIQSIQTVLQGAAAASRLGEITPDRIVRQDKVDSEHLGCSLPAIIITPGLNESEEGGTNASDDFSYPVMVAVVDRKDDQETANTPTYFYWREVVRQLFHNRRLPGVNPSFKSVVNFEIALDHKEDDEDMNWFATSLRIDCKNRELRWT
jgi:hypothetical protein